MDAIFDSFLSFDLGVFEWIQSIQSSILTTIMVVITTLGDEGIIFIAAGLVLFFTKKYRKIGLAMLISLVVMLVLNNLVLKEMLERVRPFYIFDLEGLLADKQAFIDAGRLSKFDTMVEKITVLTEKYPEMAAEWVAKYEYPNFVEKLTSFSFPSGHTSSAFAACAAILFLNKKMGIPAIIFAALMGFSRIYVEVHYCTDVIGGAIVGIIYAVIGVLLAKALYPVVEKILTLIKEKVFKKKAA
jgi:undecaprenyl-diphosphatase